MDTRTEAQVKQGGRGFSRIFGRQSFFLVAIIVVLAIAAGIINPKFFVMRNLINILEQISVLGLVAAGMTILIISGNFDISVGNIIGLAACLMAMLLKTGMNEVLAALIGILVCVACSLLNGALSIRLGAPSFIISLATIGVFHGTALAVTEGVIQTIYGQFGAISNTSLFNALPLMFVISVLGFVFVHLILNNTRLGRRVFAIGANRKAAFLSGIGVKQNTLVFFGLSGLLAGMATVVLLSRLGAALPTTGAGLELKAIGAVVIGGVPITGGTGNALGTFLGVLLIGVISNMLNLSRVNPYYQEIAYGALVILSVAVSYLRINAGKKY